MRRDRASSKRHSSVDQPSASHAEVPEATVLALEKELARLEADLDSTRDLALRDRDHSWKEAVETQRWFLSAGLAANLAGTWAMMTASALSADARSSCMRLFVFGIVAAFVAGIVQQWRWMDAFRGYDRVVNKAAAIRYRRDTLISSAAISAERPPEMLESPSEGTRPTFRGVLAAVVPFLPAAVFVLGVLRAFSRFTPT